MSYESSPLISIICHSLTFNLTLMLCHNCYDVQIHEYMCTLWQQVLTARGEAHTSRTARASARSARLSARVNTDDPNNNNPTEYFGGKEHDSFGGLLLNHDNENEKILENISKLKISTPSGGIGISGSGGNATARGLASGRGLPSHRGYITHRDSPVPHSAHSAHSPHLNARESPQNKLFGIAHSVGETCVASHLTSLLWHRSPSLSLCMCVYI